MQDIEFRFTIMSPPISEFYYLLQRNRLNECSKLLSTLTPYDTRNVLTHFADIYFSNVYNATHLDFILKSIPFFRREDGIRAILSLYHNGSKESVECMEKIRTTLQLTRKDFSEPIHDTYKENRYRLKHGSHKDFFLPTSYETMMENSILSFGRGLVVEWLKKL